MEEEFQHLFFITIGGRKFCKVSQGINTIWKQAGLPGHFSLNLQRKLIDSRAARILDKAEMRRLNAHMTHSEAVSMKTYQGRSNAEVVEDQILIENIIQTKEIRQGNGYSYYLKCLSIVFGIMLIAFVLFLLSN